MFEFLLHPWPWYISGPLISLVLLLLLGSGKTFGMSSNLRTVCAAFGAGFYPALLVIAAALVGTYAYGALRSQLPH